ncbi:MAG: hypothetical protein HFG41_02770 [Coprococcus sp.]|nr:hypothetical protein [Coprococcus sp.]
MRRRISAALLVLGIMFVMVAGCAVVKEQEIKGIITLSAEISGYGEEYEFTVRCIEPESGKQEIISHFQLPFAGGQDDAGYAVYPGLCRYASYRDMLSDDFTKLACAKIYPGGKAHAGWINEKGEFFDVTETLGLDSAGYVPVGFAEDGSFVYCDSLQTSQCYYVPYDNVTPEAVKKGSPYKMDTLKDSEYSMRFGSRITAWIDERRYLCDVEICGKNQEMSLDSRMIDIQEARYSVIPYIPDNSGKNWSGVIEPGGRKIAYLSYRPDLGYALYVRDWPKGESTKVDADALFGDGEVKSKIENIGGICITLIGWR